MLIERFKDFSNQTKKMEDYMQEKYPYRYEFVSTEEIFSKIGKYANTDLYRYAIVSSSKTHRPQGGLSTTASRMAVTSFDFNFYDRANQKDYPATTYGSGYPVTTFKPVINTIVKSMNL